MAHFQERRAGGDRRQHKSEDRRKNPNRRIESDCNEKVEFIERARFEAWLAMTDKNTEV